MSAARRFDDPLSRPVEWEHYSPLVKMDMEGSIWSCQPSMFLFINRVPKKKQCAHCGRGTRLQFENGLFLKWRKCRRCLTPMEQASLNHMLELRRTRRQE